MKKEIAIAIQNSIQFDSIQYGLDELINQGMNVDIFVPTDHNNSGYEKMYDIVAEKLINYGYNVYRSNNEKEYMLFLEPYPLHYLFGVKYEKIIMYKYSAISAKPNPVYLPFYNIDYDMILTPSNYEKKVLSIYADTYEIGNLKYKEFSFKKNKGNKKRILYLPTYNSNENIRKLLPILKKIRKNYFVSIKLHHATDNVYKFDDNTNLNNYFDEVYDSNQKLSELLENTDLVISDNSGAIFEALYLKIPIVLFAENINQSNYFDYDTLQQVLVNRKIILHTNDEKELAKLIVETMDEHITSKQIKISQELFKINGVGNNNSVNEFIKIIKDLINSNKISFKKKLILSVNKDVKQQMENYEKEIHNLRKKIFDYEQKSLLNDEKIKLKTEQLKIYETKKIYKFIGFLYKNLDKIRRK